MYETTIERSARRHVRWSGVRHLLESVAVSVLVLAGPGTARAGTLIAWNNLGMHCMDADYSVFSLLPPSNTIHAQLIDESGQLVTDPRGVTVTYQAVRDSAGSINQTSIGKTNFWEHASALFGVSVAPDVGLHGAAMPGTDNTPQVMGFDSAAGWFIAEGVPITPYDETGHANSYPLMRLVARDTLGAVLATTDIVLPVSDEMDCRSCHASGAGPAAQPIAGWVNDPDPQRDMRLNILRLHDDREGWRETWGDELRAAGYSALGLYATVTDEHTPILCARCHASEALPGSGMSGITPLTQAIHRRMAFVIDPTNDLPLESIDNHSACYRCHPGAVARRLRGVMGTALAADGTPAIQCQSCHGTMTAVAATTRTGWLDEPACQSCHTGTATSNNGEIRYLSALGAEGAPRVAVDATFATQSNVPFPGRSLYRFSRGHGGLACPACHGSTHAEFSSSQSNDNLQSQDIQGHEGMLVECTACHASVPTTVSGGPHGMHPVGQVWVDRHPDVAEQGGAGACRDCHGADYRGTVLSRAQAQRVLTTDFGTKSLWRGFQVGCYTCHTGPSGGAANPNRAPVVANGTGDTIAGRALDIALAVTDADGDAVTSRIVTQPTHGTAVLAGRVSRYRPAEGFVGNDSFRFAASDNSTDSNLGTVSVRVTCAGDCNVSFDVTIDDLVILVGVALETVPFSTCPLGDVNEDGVITVDEILQAVGTALGACRSSTSNA